MLRQITQETEYKYHILILLLYSTIIQCRYLVNVYLKHTGQHGNIAYKMTGRQVKCQIFSYVFWLQNIETCKIVMTNVILSFFVFGSKSQQKVTYQYIIKLNIIMFMWFVGIIK